MIRPAVADDAPGLARIYAHYVRTSHATFDVGAPDLEQRRHWLTAYNGPDPRHRLLVAVAGDDLLGYASSSAFGGRCAYAASVETSVYVAATHCGRGLGHQLYTALFGALHGTGVHRAYARIALPNDASVALHRRHGFATVGTMDACGRKFDRWIDVLLMQRRCE